MVAPLQKLTPQANATIKDIGSIDSLVQSFGPYITGMFSSLLLIILVTGPDALCVCTNKQRCNRCRHIVMFSLHGDALMATRLPTGTNLEDEDVVAKEVLNVDGRTYYQYESYAPYGTNGSHQVTRATTKVRCVCLLSKHGFMQPVIQLCDTNDL